MKVSSKGLTLIKTSEGLRLKAYLCPAGVWTIGYGHTGSDVCKGQVITEMEAENLLCKDLEKFERSVDKLVTININQNQFDALVSFIYNLGQSNLANSTLLKLINNNPDDPKIKAQFLRFVYANKKVMRGLVTRRQKESDLYFS